ncbi:MAG: DUF192 domain-containing protein [Bdellovibrionales bacterium]|nr:DUF192 domain-containing protein [Bdellovibrionales bacterium]
MKLYNASKNITIADDLHKAVSFLARLKGLLGKSNLRTNEALWIDNCPSIHTFFMKFTIDVVFVDEKLIVRAQYSNVKPWKFVAPVWGAKSVFELAEGTIQKLNIEVGDQLNVGH